MKKIKNFLSCLKIEWKNIVWLNKKEVKEYFLAIVIGTIIILSVIILGDFLGDELLKIVVNF